MNTDVEYEVDRLRVINAKLNMIHEHQERNLDYKSQAYRDSLDEEIKLLQEEKDVLTEQAERLNKKEIN